LAALRAGPWDEGEAQFQVAECALHRGDIERARGIYAAIQGRAFSEPARERALFEEGRALFYQAQFDSANVRFKRVAQEFPRGEHVNDALEQSILIHTNPGAPEWMGRHAAGALAIRVGRPRDAVEGLTRLVAEATGQPILDETLLLLGEAKRAARDFSGALQTLQRAVELSLVPDLDAKARLLRGDILDADLHDRDRARREYEDLIVAHPETLAADRARTRIATLVRVVP
jgi:tetratricopeptide (TPR) repeat protein